ncbi:hypothetical protein L7814_023215 [Escherichia coli]|nr:hypothetical protein [Escherichia coli]
MTINDVTQLTNIKQYLSELTPAQQQCAALFACGWRPAEIAAIRKTTLKTVKAQLDDIRKVYGLDSIHHIRNVILLRLFL